MLALHPETKYGLGAQRGYIVELQKEKGSSQIHNGLSIPRFARD